MRESLILAGTGIVIGAAVAWGGARLIASQLYGLQPRDPATMLTAVGLLAAVAMAASAVPARRASRIDPMRALRHE
jgi:ABC-type antimicrobial peptide transport system permease subunit